jgi:hypothetical protein
MDIAAVDQLARNAEVVFGFPGYAMIWTMAMTGMRPGELFGLRREYCYPNWPASDPRPDPDEEERYEEDMLRYGKGEGLMPAIRVQQQVQQVKGAGGGPAQVLLASHAGCAPLPGRHAGEAAGITRQQVGVPADPGAVWALRPSRWTTGPYISKGADERLKAPGSRNPRPAIPAVPVFAGKRMYLIRHGHKAWLDEDGHSRFAVESRMGHEVPGSRGRTAA